MVIIKMTCLFIAYSIIYTVLAPSAGTITGILVTIPVLIITGQYGLRSGIAAWIIGVLLNLALRSLIGESWQSMITDGSGMGTMVLFLIILVMGHMRHTSVQLKQELYKRQQVERELSALYNATSYLFKADDLLTLGEQIVQAVLQEFGQMDCGILLIDPSHHYLNRLVRAGDYPVLTDTPLSLSGQGLVPEAIRTGQVVYASDAHHDSRYLANVKQTRSELVIPLMTANGVIGVFDLQSPHLDGFSKHDQRLLGAYAERAAAAIESKQLYAEVQQRAAQLEWRVLQRNAELQRSQQKLQAIMDNTQAVIFVKDVNHRYMMINRQFEKLFHVRQEQIVGQTDEDIFPPEDAKIFRDNDQATVNAGKPLQFEESVLQDDGLHTYIAYKVPLMDNDDQIYAICGISTDITNLKQLEAHLFESLEKERELRELKSQFVMMTSHEFRTPLTIIQSSHELLFRYMEGMDKPQRQKHFDKVRKQIAHMTGMLDDVLLIGQLDAGVAQTQQETGNLPDFIAEVVQDFRNINTNYQIDYERPNQPLLITGNINLIRQILSNLLSNAIKYSNEQSLVLVSLDRAGHMAEIRVRDQGIGIPVADYDRVFEPFHRVSNTGTIPGVGLGLAIVHRAIELMGGTIRFESELGIGTTFIIHLPIDVAGLEAIQEVKK